MLLPGEIHVWAISLDVTPGALATLETALCPAERERAARFRFEQHRNRFIAGRGLLRNILSSYLNARPQTLEFCSGPNGKPALANLSTVNDLQFNLAHSEGLALAAVTTAGEVGVDVERVRVLDDAEELVRRFFSRSEAEIFRELPPALKPAAFFNLWTRKEAFLKATGEGIAHSMHRVEVSFLPGESARFAGLPADLGDPNAWVLRDLAPAPGFAAALAVRRTELKLRCWCWELDTGQCAWKPPRN